MLYKDLKKQRKAQREWAKKHGKKREKVSVTWKQLTRDYSKIRTWNGCLTEALKFTKGHTKNKQMAIASLALRACVIRHGGDMRSPKGKQQLKDSLTAFARKIGLHPTTLANWTRAKRQIYDSLPSELQGQAFVWSVLRMAETSVNKKPGENTAQAYIRLVTSGKKARTAVTHLEDVRRATEWFVKDPNKRINLLRPSDRDRMRKYLKTLGKIF